MTRRRLWNLKTRSIQLSQMSLHSNRKSNIEADYSLRCVCEENVRAMYFVSVGGVMQPTWGNHTSEDVDSRTLIIIITIHIFFVPSDNDVSWCAIWYQPMWDEVSLQNSTWNLNGGGEGRMMHLWLKGQRNFLYPQNRFFALWGFWFWHIFETNSMLFHKRPVKAVMG